MKIFLRTFLCLLLPLTGLITTGCCDNHIEAVAFVTCSEDLLEFVIPTVTIEANGTSQTYVLSEADFEESTNEPTDESNKKNTLVAKISKDFDGKSISGSVTVQYSLKKDVEITKDQYYFKHSVNYSLIPHVKGLIYNGVSIAPTVGRFVEKDAVESYLNNLISEEDSKNFQL